MKKSELVALLKDVPDDATVCVEDSYGAFHEFQHFSKSYFKQLADVDGNRTWYWVLDTCGDEDGYKGKWQDKRVREFPCFPEKALEFLSLKRYNPEFFELTTPLAQWCPRITGGNEKDKEEFARAAEKYWKELSEYLGIPAEKLYGMTLGDLK